MFLKKIIHKQLWSLTKLKFFFYLQLAAKKQLIRKIKHELIINFFF